MMAASLALPIALFAIASTISYRSTCETADREIERTLDVAHEHALKVFETIDRSLSEINEIARGLSDDEIRAREEELHGRLKQVVESLPQMKSAWIFDAHGRALVNSLVAPAPQVDFSDRDYFNAHVDQNIGTFIGAPLAPRQPYQGASFFGMSRRRDGDDGRFIGIIQVSVLPEYFENFYTRIGRDPGSFFAIGRTDGVVLAQFPLSVRNERVDPSGPLGRYIAAHPQHGLLTITWPADRIERRIGYERVAEYPIYVSAGLESSAIRARWIAAMAQHLVFGFPATALLFLILALALRRTRYLYAEAEKRRDAEEALKHSQRLEALGQLTGGVAHDFNNLLTVIRASTDLLARPQLSEERRSRYIKAIADSVSRAAKLTSQLLAFARRQTLKPEVFEVRKCLLGLREMMGTLMGSPIEIIMQLPDEDCFISADIGQFETTLINIAVNARDAMSGKGTITFAVDAVECIPGQPSPSASPHGFVAVSVTDTGVGIPAEHLDRIFEPFFTTKDVGQGTGLGLSQVFGFAKQSGGEVSVTSEFGNGSTFTLYLPRVAGESRPPRLAPDIEPAITGKGMSVLVVDDDDAVAGFTADGLSELGYGVTVAESAAEALVELAKAANRFDVVFSDIAMPGMTGLDLMREMRNRGIDTPVILTSGYSSVRSQSGTAGLELLQKPYSIEQLSQALHRATGLKVAQGTSQ